MSGITLPIILTVIAAIAALIAYQGIRRGGARFYTLERESMLRRARFTLLGSLMLFLAAIALLIYSYGQISDDNGLSSGDDPLNVATEEPDELFETQPPTPSPSPTVDPSLPTPTPTETICRAIVEGTSGSGLTLRDAPGGGEMTILRDGSYLTLIVGEEPVEANGFDWIKVRTVSLEEGWVAEEFLIMGECR
ncbi:MAG: SH3 domain-containing protein [Candidatus Promineifilaceae bacterium]